jgi:hypothetical protein
MMMNKNDFKIKYVIGTYKDNPTYPSKEDLYAMADMWYHLEGGKDFIHKYRGLDDGGETIFTEDLISHKGLPKGKTKILLKELLESGDVEIFKETKHTKYHIITKR